MFHYSKSRLIGISDGVFAVVLTIMVLDIKSPVSTARGPMIDLIKHLLIYFISFGIVSEYWVYHQELLSGIKRTTPLLTITNIYYLVFISLTPFATGWLNDAFMERMPSMAYSVVIILVNFTQAVMFHEVVDIGEEDGMKMTAHDREEYLASEVMLGISVIYLVFAYFTPKYFLIVIWIGLALRTIVTHVARAIERIQTRKQTNSFNFNEPLRNNLL
ncbi:TMEM175 family protein [Lentilactobacillus parabuchneri]|uniref:TMEM175 family protein n=1 Tax=Lentilactobacillus parabuchneri TaxID=152331 RepID=UPI0022357DFE|nr:TMEM175 family protein [Lentilactobacillus parabuchneri]MCW4398951.1 TMEM175 family protein [Lentilactobacillus parabuchneri]